MSTQPTYVAFLLDRTGSMERVKAQTIAGFNAYLAGLKAEGEAIAFSLIQFDSVSIDVLHAGVPVGQVPPLTEAGYQPRASTPLVDACVKTIRAVEVALEGRDPATKVVVTFQTDGEENCSTEHDWIELNLLVKEKMGQGWEFNFLGAGIDAYQQGERMGLAPAKVMSYADGVEETVAAFSERAERTVAYSRALASDMDIEPAAKRAAGDRFVERAKSGRSVSLQPRPQPQPRSVAAGAGRRMVGEIKL